MSSWVEITHAVSTRAGERCEYCAMHQSLQGASFHVDYIIPASRGGLTEMDNLAWSCPGCNPRKSDRTEVVDPESGVLVPLFQPRQQRWTDHFRWDKEHVSGLTAIGRATVAALDLNHPRRVLIRHAERLFTLFPPQST